MKTYHTFNSSLKFELEKNVIRLLCNQSKCQILMKPIKKMKTIKKWKQLRWKQTYICSKKEFDFLRSCWHVFTDSWRVCVWLWRVLVEPELNILFLLQFKYFYLSHHNNKFNNCTTEETKPWRRIFKLNFASVFFYW